MATTKIQWATKVWNPVTGCNKVSEGCEHCYAEKFAKRMKSHPNPKIANKYRNGFEITLHEDSLYEPYKWNKSERIFICSMGDLFHNDVPFEFIRKVIGVIHDNPTHTFLIITKRPQRMREFFVWLNNSNLVVNFPNMWLGVTAENQQRADERLPVLLKIPAAIRFVSVEPMLEPIDISMYMVSGWDSPPYDDVIHWVICGGETGSGARPMNSDWVKSLRDRCFVYETPFFFKQWGGKDKSSEIDGKEWKQLPTTKN